MSGESWAKQSESLIEVQKYGSSLEKQIRDLLDWDSGRVIYDHQRQYTIQTDSVFPSTKAPEIIASVTYANPDKPGHSNENKLQLKLGELALLKNAYPDITAILVLGGTQEAWLPYVLQAFKYFYDDIFYLWDENDYARLIEYSKKKPKIEGKHQSFWKNMRASWEEISFLDVKTVPPSGLVRYAVLDKLKEYGGAKSPEKILNQIARFCMQESIASSGTEWGHFTSSNWDAIEMSRSYFNPVEALTHIILTNNKLKFQGGFLPNF